MEYISIIDSTFGVGYISSGHEEIGEGIGTIGHQQECREIKENSISSSVVNLFTTVHGSEPWKLPMTFSAQNFNSCELWNSLSKSSSSASPTSDLNLSAHSQLFDRDLGHDIMMTTSLNEATQWNYPSHTTTASNLYQEMMFSWHTFPSDRFNPGTNTPDISTSSLSPRPPGDQDPKSGPVDARTNSQADPDFSSTIQKALDFTQKLEGSPSPTKDASLDRQTKTTRTTGISTLAQSDHIFCPRSTTCADEKRRRWKVSPEPHLSPSSRHVNRTSRHEDRCNHNHIEKKYRSKLNASFEILLAALPQDLVTKSNEPHTTLRQQGKAISKAEVLALAKGYIEMLEDGMELLREKKAGLSREVEHLRLVRVLRE